MTNAKIGRNDLCPCGSGKKFKKCCLKIKNTDQSEIKTIRIVKDNKGNQPKHYRLAADLNILQDNVIVKGLHIQGNLNIQNSKNVQLHKNLIESVGSDTMAGNINIGDENEFNLTENIVSGNVNIGSKNKFTLTKNMIGYDDEIILNSLNLLFETNPTTQQIKNSLKILQNELLPKKEVKNGIERLLQAENNKHKGEISRRIINHLKKVGMIAIADAEKLGLKAVWEWFMTIWN